MVVMETLAFILTCTLCICLIMLPSERTNIVVILTRQNWGVGGKEETWPCVSILYFNFCALNSVNS